MAGDALAEHGALATGLIEAITELQAGLQAPERTRGSELSRSQLATLSYLTEHGACAMQDLAAGVGVTPATMTSTVKLLVRKGLVERRHDEEDWRTVRVSASSLGTQAQEQSLHARTAALAGAIQSLSAEHRALLMVALPALRALALQMAR